MRRRLPPLFVRVVEWLVRDPIARTGLLGDMTERYEKLHAAGAARRARWLASELASIAVHYTREEGTGVMDTLLQDLAFTVRAMRRRPGFSLLLVFTIILGIGSNTAIFSVVNGLLLEPLPFEEGERLALVNEREPTGFTASVSFPNYRDWKERARSFDRFCIVLPGSRRYVRGDGARIVEVAYVGGGFFETLAVEPELGRFFTEAESDPGSDRLAVLSHGFWTDDFGADPEVLGQTVELGGEPFAVIGVAPPDFIVYERTQAFLPLGIMEERLPWNDRLTSVGAEVVARLAPDVTFDEAAAELRAIGEDIEAESGQATGVGNVIPLRRWFVGDVGRQSLLLMAAVGLLLLVACANVANLLFVASERRRGEIAIRSALGASRWRVYRQLLTESLVVSFLGGAGGLLLAVLGLDMLLRLVGDILPVGFSDRIDIDARVLAFAAAVSMATGLLAGFLPALRSAGVELAARLRSSARRGTGGTTRTRLSLVSAEVALSMVLLVGAGLLIVTLMELQNVEKGFDAGNVLTLRLQAPDERVATRETWVDFHRSVRDEIGAIPGVVSVSTSNHFPLSGNSWEMLYRDENTPAEDHGASVLLTMVTPSFFETYGVSILEGRNFDDGDRWGTDPVAVVDETLARTRWPGESAIGKRVTFEKVRGPDGNEVDLWRTVVGVARHVRHYELTSPSRIEAYTPLAQSAAWGFTSYVSVRTTTDPGPLTPRIRAILADLEPDATLYRVRTMDGVVEEELGVHRAMRELLTTLALITLLLGGVGIYSVISHTTALRIKELGLRIALGGEPGRITGLVVGESLVPIGIGIAIGAIGALAVGELLRSVLYEVGPADPRVLASAAGILLLVATVSAWLPARRAARIQPHEVLREE
ncbi:MAG: ABC transporter permease [Longimicrobiales bacterium]|nr:ABC transporter permease [Longimicrobiales bacterium]